jgi:hypothetical protein
MSKILKRPMFRKGGPAMSGIMSGIKPRQNYALGEDVQAYRDEFTEAYGSVPRGGAFDPLTQLLIGFGQQAMTEPSSGNVLRDLVKASKKPSETFFKAKSKEAADRRNVQLAATKFGLTEAGKDRRLDKQISAYAERNKPDVAAERNAEIKDLMANNPQFQNNPVLAGNVVDFNNTEQAKLVEALEGMKFPKEAPNGLMTSEKQISKMVKAAEKRPERYKGKGFYDAISGKSFQFLEDGSIEEIKFSTSEEVITPGSESNQSTTGEEIINQKTGEKVDLEERDTTYSYPRGSADFTQQRKDILEANRKARGTVPEQREGKTTLNTRMSPEQNKRYLEILKEYGIE